MRKAILIALIIILPLMLVGCVSMALPRVPDRMASDVATPPVLADGDATAEQWEAGQAQLRATFEAEIYGRWPEDRPARLLETRIVDEAGYGGLATIEESRIEMAGIETHLVTVRPNAGEGPHPVIIMQMFCGNRAALGDREDISAPLSPYAPDCSDSWQMIPIRMIFGENIAEPPMELILERGYAVAFVYPGDIVPDQAEAGTEALARLVPGETSGAIIAWAWIYSRVIDLLDADARFDNERTAVWGHSRNGKSALLAAAFDERVDLVIAHQAGTGGTTLTRSHAGESVEQITGGYPHWFAPSYAAYADREDSLPVDQHQLIALMAPRPILIGAAWRDQWSDPQGSFRAAEGANPVYQLYGSDGLRQPNLASYDPTADIALFMRPGLHGVNGRDWANFLAFLDAHFMAQ